MPRTQYIDPAGVDLEERVVNIWRCAATVKGGRRFSFSAMVVVGSGSGLVAWGYGKAREVPGAIEKGLRTQLKLNVQVVNLPEARDLSVKLNGQGLSNAELTWETDMPETWQEYALDPRIVKKGRNTLEITLTADTDFKHPCVVHDVHLRIDYSKTS